MQILRTAIVALLLAACLPASALAHSIEELEQQFSAAEKYFQPIDKAAPDFKLQDAEGRVFRLGDFRKKVVVLHFIYTRCTDLCPLHAERIAKIQSMIDTTPMKAQVQFISITTDPSNDRGELLRDYGPQHGLDPVNWMFLTTTPDEPEDATRRLAEAFGHRFTKAKDGYQMHGIVTHVIDREGNWRGNFHGLKFDPVNLVMFVNALVNTDVHDVHPEKHPDSEKGIWDRLLEMF
jgi:protein SCO1/2